MAPPESVIDEAVRLTRLARRSTDVETASTYRNRRDDLLAEYGFTARVRSQGSTRRDPSTPDADGAILVCYPDEWVIDGTVDPARIEDISRALERPIEGTATDEDWETIEAHNRAVAEQITAEHGPTHGANAHAFADFMSNHYASRVERAGPAHVREFLGEYFPRNTWPTADQRAVVAESVALIVED